MLRIYIINPLRVFGTPSGEKEAGPVSGSRARNSRAAVPQLEGKRKGASRESFGFCGFRASFRAFGV